VYQATRNSSQTTRQAATDLVEALGGNMACLEIDDLVQSYVGGIETILGRKLTWIATTWRCRTSKPGCAGERVAAGHVKNALLLATSNRSEAAVGYATMDGDTCGGLSRSRIDKAFLLTWIRWLETVGPEAFTLSRRWSHHAASAHGRIAPAGEQADRRSRLDAVSGVGRDRARGHPRQAVAAGGVSRDPLQFQHNTPTRSANGSSGSSSCGAATSGSGERLCASFTWT